MCKACDGTGLLADDEGWKYHCPLCSSVIMSYTEHDIQGTEVLAVDDNNRLLD